jgi:hypothetical protein
LKLSAARSGSHRSSQGRKDQVAIRSMERIREGLFVMLGRPFRKRQRG